MAILSHHLPIVIYIASTAKSLGRSLECLKHYITYVIRFEVTHLPRTIINRIFRNTNFNYLKFYNSGWETDTCMKFATIL